MGEFKVATFNANSIRMRKDIVVDWLGKEKPDVLCVQETKVQDPDFPEKPFRNAGYHCAYIGQKKFNGVAVFTREEPEEMRPGLCDGKEDPEQARLMYVRSSGVDVVNTYIPQGFEPGTEKFEYKLEWFRRLRKYFEKHFDPSGKVIWAGDLNVAPEQRDVYDPERLAGHCGFHPDEQAALSDVAEWGFTDIFRKHVDAEKQFTFYDYRLPKAVERGLGWRIDHIMATAPLAEKSTASYIDLEPRKLPKPSDHTFLVAVFGL